MKLRGFQDRDIQRTYNAWDRGARDVLLVEPTGAGKTVMVGNVINDMNVATCAIAHRQELVSQLSLALNRYKVRHRIIGQDKVIRVIVNAHMNDTGDSYYEPSAQCAVAGVDTLVRRRASLGSWLQSVRLTVQDEAHHLLRVNKWGTARNMFPNAIGLGVTATPMRADGKGLGRNADGVFDEMVVGSTMRELIDNGYLTDYRVIAPPPALLMDDNDIGATGDYKYDAVVREFRANRTRIIGDIVGTYLKFARGKLGVTFVPSVDDAIEVTKAFNDAGVPAEVVTAETPIAERAAILRRFKNRELLQLVNCDLFGEGFDLPAIECVSFGRATASFSLFCQQFGRAIRLMISDFLNDTWDSFNPEQRKQFIAESDKPVAMIFDHVGNVLRHGLPDAGRQWTLDARDRRSDSPNDVIPTRTCLNPLCMSAYERIYNVCPFCGHIPEIIGRASPEQVDGDLIELDAETLAAMRGDIQKIDMSHADYRDHLINKGCPKVGINANMERHGDDRISQGHLRDSISAWAGWQRHHFDRPDSEIYRRFYFKFGIDIMSAQALKTKPALALCDRINEDMTK